MNSISPPLTLKNGYDLFIVSNVCGFNVKKSFSEEFLHRHFIHISTNKNYERGQLADKTKRLLLKSLAVPNCLMKQEKLHKDNLGYELVEDEKDRSTETFCVILWKK